MASLDMEPFNIMGDRYQVERKPTLKPPVVDILLFFRKKHRCFKSLATLTYVSWFSGINGNRHYRYLLSVLKRCGWQDGLASRLLRRLQSGRRDCTSISTTGVCVEKLTEFRISILLVFLAQFFLLSQFNPKCLLICRVWRRIPAHFRLHYSELAEKTNVTAEDVNPISR